MSSENKVIDEGSIIYFKDTRHEHPQWKALQIFGTNKKHGEYFESLLKHKGEPEVSAVFVFHHIIGPARFIYLYFRDKHAAKKAAVLHFTELVKSKKRDTGFGKHFQFELRSFKIAYTDEPMKV